MTLTIKQNDVLFWIPEHQGTADFYELVSTKLGKNLDINEQTIEKMSKKIVDVIKNEKSGRFLNCDTKGHLSEMDEKESINNSLIAMRIYIIKQKMSLKQDNKDKDQIINNNLEGQEIDRLSSDMAKLSGLSGSLGLDDNTITTFPVVESPQGVDNFPFNVNTDQDRKRRLGSSFGSRYTLTSSTDASKKSLENIFEVNPVTEPCNTSEGTIDPEQNDVLCGQGKAAMGHPGNKEFRLLVRGIADMYKTRRNRNEKTEISKKIVDTIHKRGGRFLKEDENGSWCILDDKEAIKKTSQAIRDHLSKPGAKKVRGQ